MCPDSAPRGKLRRSGIEFAGERRPDDLGPFGDDAHRGLAAAEAAPAQRRPSDARQGGGDRPRPVIEAPIFVARSIGHDGMVRSGSARHNTHGDAAGNTPLLRGRRSFAGREAARLVRPAPARPAVARAARHDARSISRLAERDHAAADHRGDGRAIFPRFPGALADGRGAGRRAARRGAARLAGARLLRPGAQPASLRARWWHASMAAASRRTRRRLRALPGVGAYTAAAIAAIAFDRPAAVVDGNVERVMARLGGDRGAAAGCEACAARAGGRDRANVTRRAITPRR